MGSLQSARLRVYLLFGWISICHGNQGLWSCCEVDFRRQEPVWKTQRMVLRNSDCWLHCRSVELLQQSFGYIQREHVRAFLLSHSIHPEETSTV